jgi:hypothetical protein
MPTGVSVRGELDGRIWKEDVDVMWMYYPRILLGTAWHSTTKHKHQRILMSNVYRMKCDVDKKAIGLYRECA